MPGRRFALLPGIQGVTRVHVPTVNDGSQTWRERGATSGRECVNRAHRYLPARELRLRFPVVTCVAGMAAGLGWDTRRIAWTMVRVPNRSPRYTRTNTRIVPIRHRTVRVTLIMGSSRVSENVDTRSTGDERITIKPKVTRELLIIDVIREVPHVFRVVTLGDQLLRVVFGR